ncbi:MAG: cytidylate kinase-like family protein [Eubacteriales bacterium]|nr:cytidylate kinase-like family protein [Eubacteriales bacterium]
MDGKQIITVGRQIGSGGSWIGEETARRLGVRCYDRQLIEMACAYGQVDLERMRAAEEKRPNPFLYQVPREIQNDKTGRGIAIQDMVFNLQSDVIRMLAREESCVIIGRSADYVLREDPDAFSVFICADMDQRIETVMTEYRLTRDQAVSLIKKTDKARRNYYECYTGKRWGARESYDLTLNSSKLGRAGCVELICDLYRKRVAAREEQ